MKTVENRTAGAFQFNPKALEGLSEEAMQETIAKALNHSDGMAEAYVAEGVLRVALYTSRSEGSPFFSKYHVSMRPGQWLTVEDNFPSVWNNRQYRTHHLEEKLANWLNSTFSK